MNQIIRLRTPKPVLTSHHLPLISLLKVILDSKVTLYWDSMCSTCKMGSLDISSLNLFKRFRLYKFCFRWFWRWWFQKILFQSVIAFRLLLNVVFLIIVLKLFFQLKEFLIIFIILILVRNLITVIELELKAYINTLVSSSRFNFWLKYYNILLNFFIYIWICQPKLVLVFLDLSFISYLLLLKSFSDQFLTLTCESSMSLVKFNNLFLIILLSLSSKLISYEIHVKFLFLFCHCFLKWCTILSTFFFDCCVSYIFAFLLDNLFSID